MRLTRRDVVAALAASGIVITGREVFNRVSQSPLPGRHLSEAEVSTLVALAEVLYPSAIGGIESFVTEYVRSRVNADTDRREGMSTAAAYLDDYANAWEDAPFAALDIETRHELLQAMNIGETAALPDGSDVERVRYYLIDELLFALYSTPTGGKLIGIENPPGYPGGIDSYRTGPQS